MRSVAAAVATGVLLLAEVSAHASGLVFLGLQRDGVGGVDGIGGANTIAVSPDGAHVYVTGSFDDAVAAFARDPVTGGLTFVDQQKDGVGGVDGLDGPAVTVSPDGAHVYVTGSGDDAVTAFRRDPATGVLAFVEVEKDGVAGVDGLDGAISVAVSPDGTHVYVASSIDDAVAVFGRDPATGALAFVQARKDGVGGVDGLDGARRIIVSPDGAHVYVVSTGDDAVAVFSRNSATGALAFVEVEKNGVAGVDGLQNASAVAISPDGADVYVTSPSQNSVAVFRRDPASGALHFVEVQRDGVGGVDGLDFATFVVVSPDGAHVYVSSSDDHAVAAFTRDPAGGALTFLGLVRDGVAGVDGLAGALAVAVSPDGAHVYAAGQLDNAVATFRRIACGDGHTDPDEECDDGNRLDGDCCSPTCRLDAAGSACTDDGDACTTDLCDAAGACTHPVAPGLPCADDGSVCTADVCDAAGACTHPVAPGLPCADDGSVCTADVCDAAGACVHPAAPAADCHGAAGRRGRLFLADGRGARDRLAWRWRGTTPGGRDAFGDPLAATGYALCVYGPDGAGTPALQLETIVPPGGQCGRKACWTRVRGGFAYRDRKGRNGAVRALRLTGQRITVVGRGAQLGLPAFAFGTGDPVTAQLRRTDDGACWNTTFVRALRRTKRLYRARTD